MAKIEVDAPSEASAEPSSAGRLRRIMHGWSANLIQMCLGLTQQLLLLPTFLLFWSSDTLAAWLVIYAAGSLVVIADAGLQLRAINRFLAFKSSVDCNGRTASFFAGMLQIYLWIVAVLGVLLVLSAELYPPAAILGFQATPTFTAAMLVMTVGTLLALPANLVSGLYRAQGKYGRAVWSQNAALLLGQIGQLAAIGWFGNLLAVAIAYISTQMLLAIFLVAYDAPRQFPLLRRSRRRHSWRWDVGQLVRAFPFAIANVTELALANVPVLLVSVLVTNRVAVVQWGLTRVIASFVRGLCIQVTLPLAAELGHDYAVGDKERLSRLYAYASVLVTVIASLMVAGLLPFWSDFFALWTHGKIPNDVPLTLTLLIGSAAAAPSLLALVFANHSDRGYLLLWTKGLQLIVFLTLSVLLIRRLGPLGAAIAMVASDLLIQFGLLAQVIMRHTLRYPLLHVLILVAMMLIIMISGFVIGLTIRSLVPGAGLQRFLGECGIWLAVIGGAVSPLLMKRVRERCLAAIPN